MLPLPPFNSKSTSVTMSSEVKMSPPYISDIPQQPYPQDAKASRNAVLAQNYRDQCQFHFFFLVLTAIIILGAT